jgi:hypothetical protein
MYKGWKSVGDQQLWDLGILRLKAVISGLPVESELLLNGLLVRYQLAKASHADIISEIGASSVCRECGGECCQNGKYRISVFDVLAHFLDEFETSVNFMQKPLCPYGSSAGCSMGASMRPADCIAFICDEIDLKLSPHSRNMIAASEKELRECIEQVSRLTGQPMGIPLLIWAARLR